MKLSKKLLACLLCLVGILLFSVPALAESNTIAVTDFEVTDADSSSKNVVVTLNNSQITSAILEYSVSDEIYSAKSKSVEENKIEFKLDCSIAGDYEFELLMVNLKNGSTEYITLNEPGFNISLKESKEEIPLASGAVATKLNAPKNAAGKTVIVLDPGHDTYHTGAQRYGLSEETLNLKIALAAYNELKTYSDVEVYLTRSGAGCPVGGGNLSNCLLHRSNLAKNKGAHLFVSFHNNSTGAQSQTSMSGAYVYISNHSKYLYGSSQRLANCILNALKNSLGIKTHGAWTNADDAGVGNYNDGRHMDDLSVIRNCVLNNIEPALIEHMFMNNPNDAAVLKNDAKLTQMGIADAKGIAEYLGLSKDTWKPGTINCSISGANVTITASVSGTIKNPKYKFVYNKYNPETKSYDWSDWDTLRNFDSSNTITWENVPGEGNYRIIVDIMDDKGTVKNGVTSFDIIPTVNFTGVNVPSSAQMGDTINISPKITGETDTIKYKYVWNYNNWQKWDTIANFTSEQSVPLTLNYAGTYTIYIDIQGPKGTFMTKNASIKVTKPDIGFSGIGVSNANPEFGDAIEITPNVNNPIPGLKYKFLWVKDNWKQWGVIQNLSDINKASYKCLTAGPITLYVDVMYPDGSVITKTYTINVKNPKPTGYQSVSVPATANVGDTITIKPNITNPHNMKFEYKFVYSYNNWSEWDVIQGISDKDTATFQIQKPGKYDFYVDIKTPYGTFETKSAKTTGVLNWNMTALPAITKVGDTVTIKPNVTNSSAFEYKFVYSNNNWNYWKVIQEMSGKNTVTFQIPKPGKNEFIVDIKTPGGTFESKKVSTTTALGWDIKSFDLSSYSIPVNTKITMKTQTSGTGKDLKYKFVWQKNNWKQWDTIQNLSSTNTAEFTPTERGTYTLYADVMDGFGNGKTVTKTLTVR